MEKITNLSLSEMINISGGINIAYELGYAIGTTVRRLADIVGIASLFV